MKAGLKPAEIAAQCKVTSNSIRNWSKEFRAHLSEGANAPERYYTDRDATVLRYISTLKQEGMKAHEIAERLAEMTFGETESFDTSDQEPATTTQSDVAFNALTPPASPDAPHAPPAIVVAIDDLQRRFEALEVATAKGRQTQRDFVVGLALGAIGALVFVALLLLLFLVRHYL